MKHVKLFEAFINESEIKIGTFVRYVKDDDFTGGKVVDIKGNKAEIRNWDGSTIYLPVKDLEYVPSWNESMIENFISEAVKFINFKFNSHKNHNPYCDILQGHLDKDTFITYGIYIKDSDTRKKGDEFMEYYTGENYNVDSSKKSNSRIYTVDKIPTKYKAAWEELKAKYEAEYK